MPNPPDPTWLFHITAIDNLAKIVTTSCLLSKSSLYQQAIQHASIAYEHIQDRRARRPVPVAPGGMLHDYVPFHFGPRSPMLFTIHQGNVPGCTHTQEDIVHLCTTAQDVAAAGLPFVFSDFHAVLDYAQFSKDLKDLSRIDWPLFFEQPLRGGYCPYWKNDSAPHHMRRKETRQAEFLVHQKVPIAAIKGIAACTDTAATRVRTVLQQVGWNVPVKTVPAWYY
jgi:hypothetical protein